MLIKSQSDENNDVPNLNSYAQHEDSWGLFSLFSSLTCSMRPALALGTIVTIGIVGLNLEMFMAVLPVVVMTIMQAAERFFEASATAWWQWWQRWQRTKW